ncbi:MAG: PD40 domain-containing protein, partial [Bacteroidetes bacterium]|nr:PD40 domain-containing protein [Bacteroidota bacterium]
MDIARAATSTPELLVGINSVVAGTPQLSFGNLIGASIVLITLVAGIAGVIHKNVCVLCSLSGKEVMLLSVVIMAPLLVALDRTLTRLTFGDSSSYQPFWSPDGDEVGFTSERAGLPALYSR